jgi:hypothetical protein
MASGGCTGHRAAAVVRAGRDESPRGGSTGSDAAWAMDSTPMWCYGAVLETVRMLGDGLVKLGLGWAEASTAWARR